MAAVQIADRTFYSLIPLKAFCDGRKASAFRFSCERDAEKGLARRPRPMSDQVLALLIAIGLFLLMAAWIPLLEFMLRVSRRLRESGG